MRSQCLQMRRIYPHGALFRPCTYAPTDEGKKLIDALGPVNVYSLGDIKKETVSAAETQIRSWLKKFKATKATGKSDKDIDKIRSRELWNIAFNLDDADATDSQLVRTLRGKVTWDHHAGILLVRAKGGGPLTPNTKEKELWMFSADGSTHILRLSNSKTRQRRSPQKVSSPGNLAVQAARRRCSQTRAPAIAPPAPSIPPRETETRDGFP